MGVIASLFTTGVLFTAILFYFVYGERLAVKDLGGIVMILVSVNLISMSESGGNSNEIADDVDEIQVGDQSKYLYLSVMFAIFCGLTFSLNSWVVKHYPIKYGFDAI